MMISRFTGPRRAPFASRPLSSWRGPSCSRHGVSIGGIIFFLCIIAIFIFARTLRDQSERETRANRSAAMSDPETMLTRFFIERGKTLQYKDKEWNKLLDFMSRDDIEWIEQNRLQLASYNNRTSGMVALAVTEGEQIYSALEYLLKFGPAAERPIIVQIYTHDRHAVAYFHPPGNLAGLKEIFLIRERDDWKIRRFLGARDEPYLMEQFIEAKTLSGAPFTQEELNYQDNPEGYAEWHRQKLFTESGLDPNQSP